MIKSSNTCDACDTAERDNGSDYVNVNYSGNLNW